MSDRVDLEADDYTMAEDDVMIKGRAHVLSATADIFDAQEAPLLISSTSKPLYMQVTPSRSPSRRFKFGSEPDRERSTFT